MNTRIALITLGIITGISQSVEAQTCGTGEATGFVYPIQNWRQSCGFDVYCARAHHMGVDGVPSFRKVVQTLL